MIKKIVSTMLLVFSLSVPILLLTGCGKEKSLNLKTVYSNLDMAQMYQLAEVGININTDDDINVYDTEDISVNAVIDSPDGNTYIIPMFYYEEYARRLNGDREYLYKVSDGEFRFRFTPRVSGEYSYQIKIKIKDFETTYPKKKETFFVSAGTKDAFLKISKDNRHLEFDNGNPYIGLGNNFCGWEWAGDDHMDGTFGDDRWFQELAANGGTLTQFDLCEGDNLEWTRLDGELEWSDCYDGLLHYNQKIGFKTDYKVQLCDTLGLFYRFSLYHWGDFDHGTQSFSEWGWARNPYNIANGGTAKDVTEFFSGAKSKKASRNYIRYCVARWGYSTSLLTWELWNEVDAELMCWEEGMDYYTGGTSYVVSWHDEMAKYLKSIDIYDHMISTSTGNSADNSGTDLWALDSIDITTVHRYTMHNGWFNETAGESVKAIKHILNARYDSADKPSYVGEYGLSPSGEEQRENDLDAVAFHNGLYSTIFSNSMGTAMHWTWGSYIDEYQLYFHYRALNKLFVGADLRFAERFDNLNTKAGDDVVWYMGLKSKDQTHAYLWIKDSKYDYNFTSEGYEAKEMVSGNITITNMLPGNYFIEFIDNYTGNAIDVVNATCGDNGKLIITYPSFEKDISAKVVKEEDYYQSADIASSGQNFTPTASYTIQNPAQVTIYSLGNDIGGSGDSGRFAYLTVTGNFTYTARIEKTNHGAAGAKGGVMVRDNLNSGSKMSFIGCYDDGNYISLQRKSSAVNAVATLAGRHSLGCYLRIVRNGLILSTYMSEDGLNYTLVSEMQYEKLSDTLLVGLMCSNKNMYGYSKAVFKDIELIKSGDN